MLGLLATMYELIQSGEGDTMITLPVEVVYGLVAGALLAVAVFATTRP